MEIQFGEYLPDLPPYNNPGVTVAKNVVAVSNNYQPFLNSNVYSNALDSTCQGAVSFKDKTGNTVNFAGTAAKLYKSSIGTYSDISKTGGYTTSAEERWRFIKFNDQIIATNYSDPIQAFTLSSSTKFADLAAGAPQARCIARVKDFVVVGNTFDTTDGVVPHRMRWPGIGDTTAWTVSATTQADYNDLDATPGYVKAIVGGEYGTIFQERAITRMTYIGSPAVFRFDQVEIGKGTPATDSVIRVGNYIFYLGLDGFYVFDGTQSSPIGDNKINRTFWSEVDLNYLSRICATVDYQKQLIYWAYPIAGNVSGRPNKILAFNYGANASKRWSTIEGIDVEFLYTSLSEGYTLDSLDSVNTNIDAFTISLDSLVWTGQNFLLSGFDSSHRQINFNGTAMTATIETQEVQLNEGQFTDVQLVRPLVDGANSLTMQLGTRNKLTDSITWSTSSTPDSMGNCPFRSNAVYQRARVTITGGFTNAQGISIVQSAAGGMR